MLGVKNLYLINFNEFRFSYNFVFISYLNLISNFGSIEIILLEKIVENVDLFKFDKLY